MTSQAPESIRVAHGVVWHAGGGPEPSRLFIESDSLRLTSDHRGEVIVELAFDDLAAIKLPPAAKGRRVIVLESRQGEWIEIEGVSEHRILPELLDKVIRHLLAASPSRRLILVWIQLRPGGVQAAVKLLRRHRGFSTISSAVTDVFVMDDALVLLFATGRAAARTEPLWDLIGGWAPVVKIGIAKQAYSSLDSGERTHAR